MTGAAVVVGRQLQVEVGEGQDEFRTGGDVVAPQ